MPLTIQEALNEGIAAAREGRLSPKSDKELDILLSGCRQWSASNPHSGIIGPTIDAIADEIRRRADEKTKIEASNQHKAAMEESKKLHSAVQKLHMPHWTLTPSFWVLVVTMIFAAIAAWPVIRDWIPASQPANKAASSLLQQSNSTPSSITATQTPPPIPAVIQSTNFPVK